VLRSKVRSGYGFPMQEDQKADDCCTYCYCFPCACEPASAGHARSHPRVPRQQVLAGRCWPWRLRACCTHHVRLHTGRLGSCGFAAVARWTTVRAAFAACAALFSPALAWPGLPCPSHPHCGVVRGLPTIALPAVCQDAREVKLRGPPPPKNWQQIPQVQLMEARKAGGWVGRWVKRGECVRSGPRWVRTGCSRFRAASKAGLATQPV